MNASLAGRRFAGVAVSVGTDLFNWIVDASIFAVGTPTGREFKCLLDTRRCLVFVVVVFVECL